MGADEPFEASVRHVAGWDRFIREHPRDLRKIWSAADIEAAHSKGQIGIIYGKAEGSNPDNYLVDHSMAIIVFDPDGGFRALPDILQTDRNIVVFVDQDRIRRRVAAGGAT